MSKCHGGGFASRPGDPGSFEARSWYWLKNAVESKESLSDTCFRKPASVAIKRSFLCSGFPKMLIKVGRLSVPGSAATLYRIDVSARDGVRWAPENAAQNVSRSSGVQVTRADGCKLNPL